MALPFPGMDPFLEDPAVFPDLHDAFLAQLRNDLNARLPPPYYAGLASRVWVEPAKRLVGPDVDVLKPVQTVRGNGWGDSAPGGLAVADLVETTPIVVHVPHDEFREPYLEIYAQPGGERLVTHIEVLSPTNKTPGEHGRELYSRKQSEIQHSKVHLVEIDLLRGGQHTTAVPLAELRASSKRINYHVCVHRFDRFEDFILYTWPLEECLPVIAVPLLPEHEPVLVDLQRMLQECYERGLYARRMRYDDKVPPPPLPEGAASWVAAMLRQKGLGAIDSP